MEKIKIWQKFWSGKSVFLTGHTGFKGIWLSIWLNMLGAKIHGFSLAPERGNYPQSFFEQIKAQEIITSHYINNIADYNSIKNLISAIEQVNPDIVIHMAAQPLVRESYIQPMNTFSTNIIGTVNLLEAIRNFKNNKIKSIVIVTSDKCYLNEDENTRGFIESDALGGKDPYSASKACTEIVAKSYYESFLKMQNINLATARAGNVIGGGDYSKDRLLPDYFLAYKNKTLLEIRNPDAVRPWQHVTEPLGGYLILARALYENNSIEELCTGFNFGPENDSAKPVSDIIEILSRILKDKSPEIRYIKAPNMPEANYLMLNSQKVKEKLKWQPQFSLEKAIEKTAYFYQNADKNNAVKICENDILSWMENIS